MGRVFYTNEAAVQLATELDTVLVACNLRLYQSPFVPSVSTVKADLVAALATYSGYADKTVAALLPPYIDPQGGASTNIATQQFQCTGAGVSNMIAGAWVEDAAGNVRLVMEFDQPVPMGLATDAIPLDVIFNFKN